MAMSHYYECPYCGHDLVNMECVRPECLTKRKADKEEIRIRNEKFKREKDNE